MRKLFSLFFVLLLAGAGCQSTQKNTSAHIPIETDNKVYCSSTGEIVRNPVQQQDHRIYCLQTKKTEPELNVPEDYSFTIIDDRGEKLKNLEVVHEKIMHVIVVRNDLNQFQHIHPEFDKETGVFTLKDLTFTSEGSYKIYFDFKPQSAQAGVTLSDDIEVGDSGKNRIANMNDSGKIKTVDKFKVTFNPTTTLHETPETKPEEKLISGTESRLNFQIEAKDGMPIEHVEKYLGEFGHLVILKEETLEYIHAHPPAKSLTSIYNRIPFVVNFPEAGRYKMFLEFKYGGKVYTTDYVVEVAQGEITTPPQDEHSIQH